MKNNKRLLLRIIIPIFPKLNIYTFVASSTTSLGPIYSAININKLESWDIEVIDENNYHGRFYPKNINKIIDHEKMQEERPADIVGFHESISSAIPRVYKLAKYYKSVGVKTIAGGKHVKNLPEEALNNNIDVVLFKEGENTIKELLLAIENSQPLEKVDGIGFLKKNRIFKT